MTYEQGKIKIYFGNGFRTDEFNFLVLPMWQNYSPNINLNFHNSIVGDFNNDGKADLGCIITGNVPIKGGGNQIVSKLKVFTYDGQQFSDAGIWYTFNNPCSNFNSNSRKVVYKNKNGHTSILCKCGSGIVMNIHTSLNSPNQFYTNNQLDIDNSILDDNSILIGDFFTTPQNDEILTYYPDANVNFYPPGYPPLHISHNNLPIAGKFKGNSKTDLIKINCNESFNLHTGNHAFNYLSPESTYMLVLEGKIVEVSNTVKQEHHQIIFKTAKSEKNSLSLNGLNLKIENFPIPSNNTSSNASGN